MVEWHAIDKEDILDLLKTDENGLSDHEAKLRLEKFGKNEIRQIHKINPLEIFFQQFKSVFILILFLAALFSLAIGHYIDFIVIMAIVFLNAFIGFFQQYKAEKTISEMKELLVPNVTVFRSGKLIELSSLELVPGDIIQVAEGDKITADCRILQENEIETNEAILTGESFPQSKSSGIFKMDTELANRENMLYTGTMIVKGNGRAIVVSTGMSTEFGKIAGLVQKIKIESTPLEKKMDTFSKKVAIIALVFVILTIGVGVFRGEDLFEMIFAGIALAISVIPEGIPAVIAITLALAIKRMHRHNALIRKLPAAETLGRTSVICTDKTGTLTEEKMTVLKLYCGKEYFTIENNSFWQKDKKIDPKSFKDIHQLLKIGIMCNNARIEKDEKGKILRILGDPTEKALVISADSAGLLKKEETEKEMRLKEYSFSSSRKLMSIVRKADRFLFSYVKGAPDVILKKCTRELIDDELVPLTPNRKQELIAIYEKMASEALRVLGFAFRIVPNSYTQDIAESGLIFSGFQGMIDPPRKEIKAAISDCITAGIRVKMLTGDSLLTGRAVSNMIGLDGEDIDERELSKLSEEEFDRVVMAKTVFARITPETKLRIIRSLKKQGEIVAVTGDGVNDVLALKEAHIGVAMGIRGSDVSREVSDIILLDDNFSSIVKAVREGRRVYSNLKKSIKSQLAANVGELFVVLIALLLAWPIPLMPLAVLWMNLITDSLPSLSLSVEKEDKDIMKRKPLSRKEEIFSGIAGFLTIAGIFSVAATLGIFALFYEADLAKARTLAITTAVFCEMFVVLSCRSERTLMEIGFFSNKFLIYAILIGIALQLLAIFTPLAGVFGFVHISLLELLIIVAASAPVFIFFELSKIWKSKKSKEDKNEKIV